MKGFLLLALFDISLVPEVWLSVSGSLFPVVTRFKQLVVWFSQSKMSKNKLPGSALVVNTLNSLHFNAFNVSD